ncbi:hypothetical protein E2562_000257 [Oryza meyeriana var. granulata]|uniref:DUF4220 domain-containing protein n=1 Tax=Oryza meyeriana var. granulata TaxID=110450 RepID=A0A6G1CNJ5_9ORYZ|nr:hypothetical protein E2562_000257 [Oryza meyeriana var. granulata]
MRGERCVESIDVLLHYFVPGERCVESIDVLLHYFVPYRLTRFVRVRHDNGRNGNHIGGGWKAKQLLSFASQAFFLFAACIRRHNKSTVLRILLWLAYLSGQLRRHLRPWHLTLQIGDPRHQLALVWAPILLLHLGGQETITAFSMEDNELWKRHLLGLITQVALAVYVVAKSWRT